MGKYKFRRKSRKFPYRLSSSKYPVPTFLSGAFSLVDITGESLPRVPQYSTPKEAALAAAKEDAAALARDWQIVGDDLRWAMNSFAEENNLPKPQELNLPDSPKVTCKRKGQSRHTQSADQKSLSPGTNVEEPVSTPNTQQTDSTPEEPEIIYRAVSAGLLPPPHVLRKYEETLPGSADRIFQMAEAQTTQRQEKESRMLTAAIQRSKSGIFLGFFLALAFLGVAVWLISIGNVWPGTLLGTLDLVTLVSLFVLGRRPRSGAKNLPSPTEGDTTPAD